MGTVDGVIRFVHMDRTLAQWAADRDRLRNVIALMRQAGYSVVAEGGFREEDKVE